MRSAKSKNEFTTDLGLDTMARFAFGSTASHNRVSKTDQLQGDPEATRGVCANLSRGQFDVLANGMQGDHVYGDARATCAPHAD